MSDGLFLMVLEVFLIFLILKKNSLRTCESPSGDYGTLAGIRPDQVRVQLIVLPQRILCTHYHRYTPRKAVPRSDIERMVFEVFGYD